MQVTPNKSTQPNQQGGKNAMPRRRNQNGRRPAPLCSAHSFDSFSLPISITATTQNQRYNHHHQQQCQSAPVLPSESIMNYYGNTKMTPPRKAKSAKGTPTRGSPPALKMRQSSPNFQLQRLSPPTSMDLFALPKYVDSPKANKVPPPPSQWLEEYERKKTSSESSTTSSSQKDHSNSSSDCESVVANELKALTIGGIDFNKFLLTGESSSSYSEPASPITTYPESGIHSSYHTGIRVNPLQLIAAVSAS
jgi:hypothetical protein